MNKMLIFVVLVLSVSLTYVVKFQKPKVITETVEVTKVETVKPKGVLLTISKKTLENDISKYKDISIESKALILTSIYKYSSKYNLNPLMVYAVLATESSFKFWIKHSLSTVVINKKQLKVRAIGIGAIVWEWWRDELVKHNIAKVKSDLFQISNNVEATCYILSKLTTMPILKGTKTKYESAFLRYFGGGSKNKWYVDRVNKVLANLMKQELYHE